MCVIRQTCRTETPTTDALFARTFYISFAKITLCLPRELSINRPHRYNIHIYQSFSGSTFRLDLASDLYYKNAAPMHSGVRVVGPRAASAPAGSANPLAFFKVSGTQLNFTHAHACRVAYGSTGRPPKLGGSHI